MARPRSWTTGGALVLAAGLNAAAASLMAVRETRYPERAVADESLYLTSGTVARRLTMGYNALAADLYWIRAIQHYGDVKLRLAREASRPAGTQPPAQAPAYDRLYALLDLTTTLDPEFNIAYRFGSIFLAEAYPGGAGRPDLAVTLLEKGIRARPDKWEYMQDIGFVHYWWLHDYQAASQWFEQASRVEGAPWFLRSLAATTLAEGGDRRSSRLMWQSILVSAENEWVKGDAERRLRQLDAADFIESLQRVVDRHAEATGQRASDWRTLIRAGVLPGVPTDSSGTPYEMSPTGRVELSSRSPLFPLPDEPQRLSRLPVS